MSGDSVPSKFAPSTLCAPRLFDSQAQISSFFPPSAPLYTKPAGEGGWGAWHPASREAAAASPAPTFAAESADGAGLASPWRRVPADSCEPRPHAARSGCQSRPARHRGRRTSPESGKVTSGRQCLVKDRGGSGIEVDPKDPVSSKGLPCTNLASVIALRRGLRAKRPLAAPPDRSVLPCRECSGAGGSVPASPSQLVPAECPVPWQGLPPWKYCGNKAGKGKK